MFLDAANYSNTSVFDLLSAAARGRVGVDQRLLRSIVDRGDAAVDDLLRFGLADHDDDPVPLELDLVQIFRCLRTPRAVEYYMHAARIQPFDFPDELVDAFVEVGEPALEPLIALYEELGEEEGGDIAFLLASLRVPDERVRKILLERLEYDAWDGAICLGLYGDPETGPAIDRVIAEIPEDDEESAQLRRDLERARSELTGVERPNETASAESILEDYPAEAPPDFDVLSIRDRLDLLSSDNAGYRAGAAASFFGQELDEKVRDRIFEVAKSDSDASVRAASWRSLMGEENEAVQRAMLARTSDESAPDEERAGAIVGLSFQLEDPKVRKWAEKLYTKPGTRAAALEAMRRSLDRDFSLYFPKHLNDEDPHVRREAIWGIGYLGIASEAENLRRFFEDDDFRPDALFAYSLSVRHETSRGRMRALLRKIDEAAGGLSEPEEDLVKTALDERLALKGMKPVFATEHEAGEDHVHGPDCDHDHENEHTPAPAASAKVGRNDPCPCGSGKKHKNCCGK